MMAKQANNDRKQNPRVVQNNQNNFSRPPIVSLRKRDREITPNNVERNHLIDELYSRVSDPVKLGQFVESLQRDSPQSKIVNNGNNNHETILISGKSISTLFTVFCRKSLLFH